MRIRKQLLAGMLAGLLALAGTACQVDDFEGDPLQDDPLNEGLEQDDTFGNGTGDETFDDGSGDDGMSDDT